MAQVYVAKARGVGGFEKLVAIKVISPGYSEREEFIQMLVQEAKISVLLHHANIGQVFDLGRIQDHHFIVMEYIEGPDTYRILKRSKAQKKPVPLDVAAHVVSQVCQGLDFAHRKRDARGRPLRIIHRDISPQNILISYGGDVKLVDFGIAKAAFRAAETEAGVVKGKYFYMSPEQASGQAIDQRSDIYSAGVVLYELLVGRSPYQAENLDRLIEQVRAAAVPRPSIQRPEIPEDLDRIVARACSLDPDQRYSSAHEMGHDLVACIRQRSPSFTPQRLVQFLGTLFQEELGRITPDPEIEVEEATDTLAIMSRDDFHRDAHRSLLFEPDRLGSGPQAQVGEIDKGLGADPHPARGEDGSTAVLRVRPSAPPPSTASPLGPPPSMAPPALPSVPPPAQNLAAQDLPAQQTSQVTATGTESEWEDSTDVEEERSLLYARRAGIGTAMGADVGELPPSSTGISESTSTPVSPTSTGSIPRDTPILGAAAVQRRGLALPLAVGVLVAAATAWIGAKVSSSGSLDPQIKIVSSPPGARVRWDGAWQPGVTPVRIDVEPDGRVHEVEVTLAGYETWTTKLTPMDGQVEQLAVLVPRRQGHQP